MDKHPTIFYKTMVVGVIVLFLGISVLPIITSKSVSSPFEMSLEHVAESEDNDKPLRDYKEVFTIIEGKGSGHSGFLLGFIVYIGFNVQLYLGKYYLKCYYINSKGSYTATARSVHTKIFFGILFYGGPEHLMVSGFAFGDISWEQL
jgi:hypothetical protein